MIDPAAFNIAGFVGFCEIDRERLRRWVHREFGRIERVEVMERDGLRAEAYKTDDGRRLLITNLGEAPHKWCAIAVRPSPPTVPRFKPEP